MPLYMELKAWFGCHHAYTGATHCTKVEKKKLCGKEISEPWRIICFALVQICLFSTRKKKLKHSDSQVYSKPVYDPYRWQLRKKKTMVWWLIWTKHCSLGAELIILIQSKERRRYAGWACPALIILYSLIKGRKRWGVVVDRSSESHWHHIAHMPLPAILHMLSVPLILLSIAFILLSNHLILSISAFKTTFIISHYTTKIRKAYVFG